MISKKLRRALNMTVYPRGPRPIEILNLKLIHNALRTIDAGQARCVGPESFRSGAGHASGRATQTLTMAVPALRLTPGWPLFAEALSTICTSPS